MPNKRHNKQVSPNKDGKGSHPCNKIFGGGMLGDACKAMTGRKSKIDKEVNKATKKKDKKSK